LHITPNFPTRNRIFISNKEIKNTKTGLLLIKKSRITVKSTSNLSISIQKELTMHTHSLASSLTSGLFFMAGIFVFVSGEFILSSTLFGMACLASNIQASKPKPARV